MFKIIHSYCLTLFLVASTSLASADDTVLFNGKDLDGWTFSVSQAEDKSSADEEWIVQQGVLISRGGTTGFLKYNGDFENYVLSLDWRSMRLNRNGVAISGSGSVLVHVADEMGPFLYPKSVEVIMFNDPGSIYFRDVDPFSEEPWAFRAPDFADDVEKEMGEWNRLKLICRGNRLTVLLNGTPVNQVDGLNRTKGGIAIKSARGAIGAPSFYRNIRVQPLSNVSLQEERSATARLAQFKALAARKEAAEQEKRRKQERQEKLREEEFARQWTPIDVAQDIEFTTDARRLPLPADARELEFDAKFGDIELKSPSSLASLAIFYRTEMARRGWKEVEKQRDEDSVEVTFKNGDAEVELTLDQDSDGVEISMDCRGLSFEGTNDPAGLAALGLPQPGAYVFLQKEFKLPANVRDLEFDLGYRCLFKCDLALQQTFDLLGRQLRAKGYRETRRPIITGDRRYTEFSKGRVEIGVNVFSHEHGSRAVLTYGEK